MYNKDEIKQSLTIEQVEELVNDLGGEPIKKGDILICRTICHCGDSHKLYYYNNSHLFKCFTGCDDSDAFDIFELISRNKKSAEGVDWNLGTSLKFVAQYFGFSSGNEEDFPSQELEDWLVIKRYEELQDIQERKQIVKLKVFDDRILQHLPHPRIKLWEDEGISQEVMEECGIAYNPTSGGIIIPHYDIDGNLIGIRERTLIKENEEYGKYRPTILNGVMYNHPLSFNLYNLNRSKENIALARSAIIYESEKSTLMHRSLLGKDNDISVAICGSNLISYQISLLLALGVKEIIIGLDKQFKEIGDKEFKIWTKKLQKLHEKYSRYVQISFLFDKGELLGYKDSPIDKGLDILNKLMANRVYL